MKPPRFLTAPFVAVLLGSGLAQAQVQDYRELKYPPVPQFNIPKPVTYELPNGMRLFLLEDRELPLITVTARIRTGSNFEPAEKAGLAALMGSVQRTGGTARQTGDEIDDFLAARAASVETGMGSDSASAFMNCLKQDFDDVFKVYTEVLRTPAFAQDKLDVAKVSANTGISRRNDQVGSITSREIRRIVYGVDSPLVRMTEYATIKAVTRQDLVAWHKQYYHPNNILLGVVGDFDTQQMKKKLEAAFQDWPRGPECPRDPVAFRKEPAPGYYFVEKSDVNQANIAFGHLGIEVKNPDYFAVQVMNEILGGGFASRMFSNVRSKQGLAYSVYGSLGADYVHPGMFRAGLQTKLANTTKGIAAVQKEIAEIAEKPPTAAELKLAKDSLLNSFIFHYDSKERVLGQQMTYAYYGMPADFLEQYRVNIEKVQAEDVTRVAKKYVHPEQLAILVVGKAADINPPLSTLGKVTTIDITIPPPAEGPRKVEKNAEKLQAGKQVWSTVVKKMGGDAVKKVNAFRSTANVDLTVGGQNISLKQTATLVFPEKVHQMISSPMGEQAVVLNGKESFMIVGGKARPLPSQATEEIKQEQGRSLVYLLRYYDDPTLEPVLVGEEKLGEVACQVLSVSFRKSESRMWVGADGTVLKQSYAGNHPVTRTPGKVENSFSDYRQQGEFFVAHKIERLVDGETAMSITVESFEVNPELKPELFDKPSE